MTVLSKDERIRLRELEAIVAGLESELPLLLRNIRDNKKDFIRAELIKNPTVNDDHVTRVAKALQVNQYVTTLDLTECNFGDKGAYAIAKLLRSNPLITWVRLAANRIQERGGIAIGQALEINQSVTDLYLGSTSPRSRNNFGPQGAKAIAKALKTNKTLCVLGFGYNNIQDEGAEAQADALKVNTTLNLLRLAENGLGRCNCNCQRAQSAHLHSDVPWPFSQRHWPRRNYGDCGGLEDKRPPAKAWLGQESFWCGWYRSSSWRYGL